MPVAVFEGDEAGAADSGDGLVAGCASFGEQAPEAFGAARFVVARGETLSSQVLVAVGASEALAVPRFVLVSHSTALDGLQLII